MAIRPRNLGDPISQTRNERKISLALSRMLGLQSHLAKRLLCDEHGKLKPDAEKLIGLLAVEAGMMRRGYQSDADRRLWDSGAQHIVRLLIDWTQMDSSQLARIEQQLKDHLKGTNA